MKQDLLGFSGFEEKAIDELDLSSYSIGRVIKEFKERYVISDGENDKNAEITGNLRFSAESEEDFPSVGDWIAYTDFDDLAIIHKVLPRRTLLARRSLKNKGERQVIASNIDYAFVVQAVDRDFNINRMERYMALAIQGKITPVAVLSKIDLIKPDDLNEKIELIKKRHPDLQVLTCSSLSGDGVNDIYNFLEEKQTYCFLGSSGVGKSSLINALAGDELLKVSEISDSTGKGRHTTTGRELIVLENGGIVIDNPGMREIGITDADEAIGQVFDLIEELSENCRFSDCTHMNEPGCAVLEALDNGELDPKAYNNYLKMNREAKHFESTVLEKRQKDKEFGKMVKNFKKYKKQER